MKPFATTSIHTKLLFFLVLVIGSCCTTYAQDENLTEVDTIVDNGVTRQIWFQLNPSWKINDKFKINAEVAYRTIDPNNWTRFVTKAEMAYNFEKLNIKKVSFDHSYTLGVGYFYIHNFYDFDTFEYRVHQGYKIGASITNRIYLQQYLRLEERFTNLFRSSRSFGLRFRYKIEATLDLNGLFTSKHRGIYIPADIEFFFNIKKAKQINDVIRVSPGLGYVIDPSFKVQLNLSYHYTKQEFDDLIKTNDLIFKLSVKKTFPNKKVSNPHEL
ncbi:DUF2490 domain-containing protein [Joostella sp. CR20]|uniref:DUF2490 domain-containing protein n=1 Tax=Joostella sp. CR20 TaxID=2804312 RepID=UPI00313BF432